MKKLIPVLLVVFTLFSFRREQICGDPGEDFKKLDWIAGNWKQTNAEKGKSSFERWSKLSDTEWQGLGISYQNHDSSVTENLKLVIRHNLIYYVADIPGNPEPVWYKLTELNKDGFVCENLEYSFPKKIEYHIKGNKIKATISGDGRSIDYLFKKDRKG